MKQLLRFKTFLILALLAMVGNSAWAQDESVTFSSQGYTNAQEISSYSGTNFSVTFAKGTNSNAPKYYNSGTAIRCYGGNTITVSSSTKTIASVQLSFGSSDGSNAITASVGNYSKGEWTGSANSVTFTIGGSSGNRRIAGISVTYEAGGTSTLTDSGLAWSASSASAIVGEAFTAPTLTNPNNVEVTYESTNEDVATISANGDVSIVAAGKTTIKAVFAGDNTYKAQTVSYTLTVTVVYTSLKDLQDNVTSTPQDFTLQMKDIYVTAVKNKNAYISDGTYGALIYTDGHGLEAGQKLNGTLSAKYVLYHGQTEITDFSASGLTITSEALPAQTKAIGDLSGANQSLLVTLENVTYDGTVLTDGTNSITPYTTFMSDLGLESGKTYNVTGIVILYNTTLEIAPREAADIVEVGAPATPSITLPAGYQFEVNADGGDNELPVTCSNLAAEPQLAVVFYEADGVTPTTYNWITAVINNGNIDGHIDENTGAQRTAYFKVTGKDANDNDVYSDLVTITQAAPAAASIEFNKTSLDIVAGGENRTVSFEYHNLGSNPTLQVQFFEVDEVTAATCDWVTPTFSQEDGKLDLAIAANTGAARSAYLKIYAVEKNVYSNLFTVNQAGVVVDYATLPFTFDGGRADIETTAGLTQEGLDSDYASSPKLKFNGTGDYVILKFNERPGTLTFDIKGNSFSGGTFTVQTSEDGVTYTDLETYDALADMQSEELNNLGEDVRYIKWVYTNKSSGNVALGNIALAKYSAPAPSITLPDGYDYTMDAKAGGGELPVTCSNMPANPQLEVRFYESDGTTSATYDWISATINDNGNIYGQIQENTGDARTAYFKVHGVDANNNDVYSNLVTFTQEAPVAATPTIVFNPESIDFDANGGSKTIGGDYFQLKDFDSTPSLEILFYKSDGETPAAYDWITASFNADGKIDLDYNDNTGAARTAYLKIHAVGTTVYSNLFTVNQAAAATPDVAHYYQKVSSSADLTNGDYLIVYEEGNVAFNGGLETLDAASNTIDVTIVGDKIEGNSTTDAATFTIDVTAGTLQSASGLYIGQTSDANGLKADGSTAYQNTLSIDADGNADVISSSAHLRYNATSGQDRFRYFKSASYTGQKAIQLYKRVEGAMPAASPALAVTPDVVTVPYTGGAESFTVTPSNVENAIGGYVTFYDPTDTETTVDQPKWIGISYDYSNMSLSYTITDENNTGAERTACFKYFIMCDNGGAMSNLVTVKQEAYVAPVASIAVDPNVVNATSVATEGTIDVTYNNITTVVSEVKFYDADGTTEATYDWIEAEIDANNNVYYVIDENNGVARTAYLKVYALDDDANDVYSELITINQAAYVAPALTQINLTKTLVFDTDCGLASGGYAVNDELTELSGTFEGDASATRFGGFTIKDSYINGSSIQMKKESGSITFPTIVSEYGFDVNVVYQTNEAKVYINGVESTEASAGNTSLMIATGSKYCQITSITLTPKTSEVPPTVDVEEPVITEVDGLVEIIPGSDNAQVIYTTDGTDPTYEPLNGTVYTEPFNITVDTTIKAIGVDADGNASDVVEVAVTAPVVSGVKYYKVTSTDQLEEGVDYLLVYEGEAGEGAAAYGGLNSYTGYSIGKSVALKHIGGSVVTITDEEVVPVTLKSRSEDGTKWAMRDATGWIAAVNGYNNLHGDKTEDDAIWTFDFTADANKQIFQEFTATSTRYLQYNTSSPRFAGYTGTQSAVYLYKAASYNVSVGATGYATLYYGTKNLVVPEDVEAYTYTVNNGKLEESYLYSTNEVIPAGTGVVLKAPAGEYKFAVTTEAGLEDTDNLLFGFDTPSTTVAPAAGDYLFYLLGVDNGKVGFYWGMAKGAAFTSGAHKAYLAVPTEQASGLRGFSFDGSVVGINTIGVDMPEGNAYDLQGRRVQQLQKNGLYIVDGKKMLAK